MAEEYLRRLAGDAVETMSAGLEPGTLNADVVALLAEDGIDISGKGTRSVFDLRDNGESFDYVVAVCDPEAASRCPIFPAEKKRLHWPFEDPSAVQGSEEERLSAIRPIRDKIKSAVRDFCVQELGLSVAP